MKKGLGEQICAITIESKRIAKEMERIWNRYYDIKLGKLSTAHLPCDACEEENKNGLRLHKRTPKGS